MSTNSAKISRVTGILLLLFAISTLISQSAMDLFSTVLCLYLAYQWFQARRQGASLTVTPKMGFDWLWLVWFGVAAIGFALNTPPPPETPPHFWLDRLVEFKWIFILYFMVGAFKISDFKEDDMKWLNRAALLCSAYAIIAYYFEVQAHPNDSLRLGGIYNFSMTHAHVYGVVFCFLLGYLFENFREIDRNSKILYLSTVALVGLSVLLTYTRGVWISSTIAIIVMSFLWRPRNGIFTTIICGVLAVSLYMLVPTIKDRIDFTTRITKPQEEKKTYDTERIVLWKTNLMIFKDHPLFGAGYGQNKFLLHEYYDKQGLPKDQFIGHAHNEYLHILAGTGALGLLCYLAILGTIFFQAFLVFWRTSSNQSFRKGLALGVLGGQICFLIGSLTESNFEHSKVRFGIMFMWAISIWLWQSKETTSVTPQ